MKDSTADEIISIRKELKSIINEVQEIADGISSDFVGIGNDVCASRLERMIEKDIGYAKTLLYKINL